jgi:hypothetical protein
VKTTRSVSTASALIAILMSAMLGSLPLHAANLEGRHISVRVYDRAGLSTGSRDLALAHAAVVLSRASVEVTFFPCGRRDPIPPSGCDVPLAGDEMALRIVRGMPSRDDRQASRLGDALIDWQTPRGVLATAYLDPIVCLARMAGRDVPTLLGHVIAHELGHLLMATTSHATHGLMRAVWSPAELRREISDDWAFSPFEADAMRAGIDATGLK